MNEEKKMFQDWPMKPMIILPPNAMSSEHMKLLRENHICVVTAKNPAEVKFVDPIPAVSSRSKIEDAAIRFSRKVLNQGYWSTDSTRKELSATFFEILVNGTPLDPKPSQKEQEQKAYDFERIEEMRRLAREDAKAERAALKAKAVKKDAEQA